MNYKKLLFWVSVFLPSFLFGQTILIDSCGLDTNKLLSKHEATYFNLTLQDTNFDFTNKYIAFAYASKGKIVITKQAYFDRWGRDYFNRGIAVSDQLIILTAAEKSASGYDAIVVSWSKLFLQGKNRKKVVKRFLP